MDTWTLAWEEAAAVIDHLSRRRTCHRPAVELQPSIIDQFPYSKLNYRTGTSFRLCDAQGYSSHCLATGVQILICVELPFCCKETFYSPKWEINGESNRGTAIKGGSNKGGQHRSGI